jgi:hypothetical protein
MFTRGPVDGAADAALGAAASVTAARAVDTTATIARRQLIGVLPRLRERRASHAPSTTHRVCSTVQRELLDAGETKTSRGESNRGRDQAGRRRSHAQQNR